MHPKVIKYLIPVMGIAALGTARLQAQSADAIIDKLVDKGILTVEEANELRDEADKGFNSAYQVKSGLPDWVTSLRIGGDVRGRYEMFNADDSSFRDRHRFRYRVRPGIVATLRDNFEVGFRLTSSERADNFGGDPISGNTTFQDNASKKFIFVDLAYAKWQPINTPDWTGTFTIGKMENPFAFSDMLFDGDYTPEGFAQQFSYTINDKNSLKLNFGQFALDEIGAQNNDPYLLGGQLRLESTWNKHWASSFGIGAMTITSDENLSEYPAATRRVQVFDANGVATGFQTITTTAASSDVPNIQRGNSRTGGILDNNYNPFVVDGSVTYTLEKGPLYAAAFPIRLAAEYINNPAADDENEAYSIGITFGKSGKKGLWDFSYRWKHLGGDAWYEELTDSDFGGLAPGGAYRSGTNVEGHVFKLSYSPYDSVTLGLTYFYTQLIEFSGARGAAARPDGFEDDIGRLQLDAVWKF